MIIILIPLILIEFVVYSNIKPQELDYFYDIGSEEDNYLSPIERISDKINNSDIDYRNLTSQLVYFDIPTLKGIESLDLKIKFKDNFPNNSKLSLGAKDLEEWHYLSEPIYDKTIEGLIQKYDYQTYDDLVLFKINEYAENYTLSDFQTNPPLIKLSTNQNITIPEFKIQNYESEQTEINTVLRGSLTFYIYAKDTLTGTIEKRDLNWYNKSNKGEDILNITLYNSKGNLLYTGIIPDDGIKGKLSNKSNKEEQELSFSVSGLEEGVYKLVLKNNEDMLITNVKINSEKIVLQNQFFPCESTAYFDNFEEKSKIYFKTSKQISLSAQTSHKEGANQTIRIIDGDKFIGKIRLKESGTKYEQLISASNNFYSLEVEKGDVVIKGPEFFAFSEDSWFDPFQGKNVAFKSDIAYLEKNADYVLIDYLSPEKQGEWIIASVSFNIEEDNLYIKDDKLNMMFNAPHLNENQNKTNQMQIPIDWIKITVHKKGWFGK